MRSYWNPIRMLAWQNWLIAERLRKDLTMLKPLSTNEIESLKETVARHRSVLAAGGQPDPVVVNSFVDSVVPRMIATIESQQAEIKRVSDALADEILDGVGTVNLDEDYNPSDITPEDLEQQEEGWQGL